MIRHSLLLILMLLPFPDLSPVMADTGRSPKCLAILQSEGPRLVEPGVMDDQSVELFDLESGWLELPADECLAIIRKDGWIPRRASTRVHLNDGQVFSGSLISSDSEVIMIDHLWMRELEIPLENVIRIDFKPGTKIPAGDTDRLVLVNGDLLTGFIDQVGNPTIIETDDGQRIEVPSDRVAAVALMNDPRPPAWPQLWTVDGLRMSVPNIAIDDTDHLVLPPHPFMKGRYERLPRTSEIVALVIKGDHFVPLAELPVVTTSTEPARRTSTSPRKSDSFAPLGLTDLHFSGPAKFNFQLPDGSSRLRSTITRPQRSRKWSNPILRISAGDQLLWEQEIESTHLVDIPIPPVTESLTMEIVCGMHGPVHCGITLNDPLIMKE
ncbi:MAG: hypothetical protein CMJ39_08250 [Phycisphaerae bacterium]|nr:hypothetical protein [Phycisphaerae bacterium]|tara:strand:+ start:3139 stop:4281 length:1143 start_codon:yes stop_codon:yes gene_type:complete